MVFLFGCRYYILQYLEEPISWLQNLPSAISLVIILVEFTGSINEYVICSSPNLVSFSFWHSSFLSSFYVLGVPAGTQACWLLVLVSCFFYWLAFLIQEQWRLRMFLSISPPILMTMLFILRKNVRHVKSQSEFFSLLVHLLEHFLFWNRQWWNFVPFLFSSMVQTCKIQTLQHMWSLCCSFWPSLWMDGLNSN